MDVRRGRSPRRRRSPRRATASADRSPPVGASPCRRPRPARRCRCRWPGDRRMGRRRPGFLGLGRRAAETFGDDPASEWSGVATPTPTAPSSSLERGSGTSRPGGSPSRLSSVDQAVEDGSWSAPPSAEPGRYPFARPRRGPAGGSRGRGSDVVLRVAVATGHAHLAQVAEGRRRMTSSWARTRCRRSCSGMSPSPGCACRGARSWPFAPLSVEARSRDRSAYPQIGAVDMVRLCAPRARRRARLRSREGLPALALARPADALQQARRLVSRTADPASLSFAHQAIGIVLRDSGQLTGAVAALRAGVAASRTAQPPTGWRT